MDRFKLCFLAMLLFNGLKAQDTILRYFDGLVNKGLDINGKRQGRWVGRDPDGTLRRIENYASGVKEGAYTYWEYRFADTAVTEGFYSKGAPAGTWVKKDKYLVDSTVYLPGNLKIQKVYASNVLLSVLSFQNEVRTGTWTQYHLNGKRSVECSYTNGLLDGKARCWYYNGKPAFEKDYAAGRLKGSACWDTLGVALKSCPEGNSLSPFGL